jgi:hypothetical protein
MAVDYLTEQMRLWQQIFNQFTGRKPPRPKGTGNGNLKLAPFPWRFD